MHKIIDKKMWNKTIITYLKLENNYVMMIIQIAIDCKAKVFCYDLWLYFSEGDRRWLWGAIGDAIRYCRETDVSNMVECEILLKGEMLIVRICDWIKIFCGTGWMYTIRQSLTTNACFNTFPFWTLWKIHNKNRGICIICKGKSGWNRAWIVIKLKNNRLQKLWIQKMYQKRQDAVTFLLQML